MRLWSRVGALVRKLQRRGVLRAAAVYAVTAWIAVQVAAATFPALPLPPWAHTLVVVLAIFGLPVVVAVAWAYEFTPEGIQRTVEEQQPPDLLKARGTPWGALLLVGVVSVASAGLGWAAWKAWLSPRTQTAMAGPEAPGGAVTEARLPRKRVAVLPFETATPSDSSRTLADGLTLSLIKDLDRIPDLDVISYRGVRPYRDMDVQLDSVARDLGAGSVVTGVVQRATDSLVVTLQLVNSQSSTADWTGTLRVRSDSLLTLRDEVLSEAVRGLRRALGAELETEAIRTGTDSDAALALYYDAQSLVEEGTELRREGQRAVAGGLYRRADSLLADAEERDPDWLDPTIERGWLELDRAQLPGRTLIQMDPERLRSGLRHAGRAVEASGGAAAALELRGALLSALSRIPGVDSAGTLRERAMQSLEEAVSKETDRARAWAHLSGVYRREARFEDARVAAREASEADAFLINEALYLQKAVEVAMDVGDLRKAIDLIRRGRERLPNDPWWDQAALVTLGAAGSPIQPPDSVWSILARYERLRGRTDPIARMQVAAALARLGLADSARAVLRRARESIPERARAFGWYYEANVRLHLGERDSALALLGRYLDANPDDRAHVGQDAYWEPLRDDPEFRSFVSTDSPEPAASRQ